MRREGKVSGYIKGRPSKAAIRQGEQELQDLGLCDLMQLQTDYWPRVKVTNKPTNESKDSGRCRRKACRHCHFFPPSKALPKTKGHRNKLYKTNLTMFADPCWALRTRGSRGPHNSIVQKKFLIGNPCLYLDPECSIGHGFGGDDDILDIDYHHGHYKNDNGGGDDDDGGDGSTSEVVAEQGSGQYANIEVMGDDNDVNRHHVDDDDCFPVVVCHDDACPHIDGTLDGDLGILGGCSVAQAIQVLRHSPPPNFDDDDADDTDLDEWYHVVASDNEPNEDEWCLC